MLKLIGLVLLALLGVLLLRGPQTVGELRIRTERMADFDQGSKVLVQTLADVNQTRVSLGLKTLPLESKELGQVPPDLDQNFSAVPLPDPSRFGVRLGGNFHLRLLPGMNRSHVVDHVDSRLFTGHIGTGIGDAIDRDFLPVG